jgi:copper(I)-binding protein
MKRLMLVMALFALPAVAGAPAAVVHDPWIREAPPNARALAGYMVIENRGAKALTLVGARSGAFGRVEIHRTATEGDMVQMQRIERVEIPAHSRAAFEPGGRHLMLMKPKRELRAGETVTLELVFDDGRKLPVVYTVRQASGAGHSHH